MTTIVGGICPRCGQFHDLFLAVDGSIVCPNPDGAAERIRQLKAERDAARAEVAALQRILDQAHADRDAAIADAARMEMGLVDLKARVEGLRDESIWARRGTVAENGLDTVPSAWHNGRTSLADAVLALIEEVRP